MTINTSSLGGSELPKLAPDLTAPTTWEGQRPFVRITGINASAGLTTVLSISGKGVVSYAAFIDLTAASNTIKLTIDGDVIFNDDWTTTGTNPAIIGAATATSDFFYDPVSFNSSFLLELQTPVDTNVEFEYMYRKLL